MSGIDFNGDVGEGMPHDGALLPLMTSANIACGGHAGDADIMRATVAMAHQHGVVIGAHPGFEDRANFGRVERTLSPAELRALIIRQVERLREIATVQHVKPHGALYNLAARDRAVAEVIAGAVWEVDRSMALFALAGSELVAAGRACGLVVAEEVFADRSYQPDGTLTPRGQPGALIETESAMVDQVMRMIEEGTVRATDGTDLRIKADTLCLHGDGANAVPFARILRRELGKRGVAVRAFARARS